MNIDGDGSVVRQRKRAPEFTGRLAWPRARRMPTIKGEATSIDPLRGFGLRTVFWVVMDETVTPILGLTPGPKAFPLETHARGLAGHLVFGACVDAALALVTVWSDRS